MLVDSNILVYAINVSSPKHKKSQEFMQKNVDQLEIAHQNIFEAIRILTHAKFPNPMRTNKALEAIEGIINACTVISPDYSTHRIGLELIRKYRLSSNLVFDAYLVATAVSNGVHTIATDNVSDLQKFSEIKVIPL